MYVAEKRQILEKVAVNKRWSGEDEQEEHKVYLNMDI